MNKEERIKEIEKEIAELEIRKEEWKNSNLGIPMNMILDHDIARLQLEKGDLENGTHNYRIYQLEREINMLKMLKEQAIFIGKISYDIKIKKAKKELETYKGNKKK